MGPTAVVLGCRLSPLPVRNLLSFPPSDKTHSFTMSVSLFRSSLFVLFCLLLLLLLRPCLPFARASSIDIPSTSSFPPSRMAWRHRCPWTPSATCRCRRCSLACGHTARARPWIRRYSVDVVFQATFVSRHRCIDEPSVHCPSFQD